MAFPEAWLNELMNKNEIVSVISEYTKLEPKGGRMWGFCPFHSEKEASFTVSPDKQLFHCFSCKAGGSVIQFIMQAESLPYLDSVRFLAQRVGMDMPDEVDDAKLRVEKALRDRLYSANREAALYYNSVLLSDEGKKARQYLMGRGIDGATAMRFGLGYSPDDWDSLYKHMSNNGYTREELIAAGLCIKGRRDEERTYDFFHGRLMFPVIAANGTVIAFGGRMIDGTGAKYMNTGDTLIYNKKHNVYAINLMKGKKLGELIMVEGYMDVISLHQAGIDNAVASLGTALTGQQARLMGRYASRVCYAYDGDSAGQKAMLRGVDVLSQNGVEPRVIVIPEGKDPDEFVRAYGTEAFLRLKDSAMTANQFKIESMASSFNLDTVDGRQDYAKRACSLLASLEPVERARYIKLVSERSGIAADVIRDQCGSVAPQKQSGNGNNSQGFRNNNYKKTQFLTDRAKAEQMLLACLIKSKSDAARIVQLDGYDDGLFTLEGTRHFQKLLMEAYSKGNEADVRMLIASLEADESEMPSGAIAISQDIELPYDTAKDCISSILKYEYDIKIRELAEASSKETDPVRRNQLLREQMELVMKSRSIR